MKKDPLGITISLLYNLNLLEEGEYNIHEIRNLRNLENHWITLQKYFNIFSLIQRYAPIVRLEGSKLKIIKSRIYDRLSEKQKFILHLYNQNALSPESAISIPEHFITNKITELKEYLYNITEENKYYLTEVGLDIHKSIEYLLTDLIYNEKQISEIFVEEETYKEVPTSQSINVFNITIENLNLSTYSSTDVTTSSEEEYLIQIKE